MRVKIRTWTVFRYVFSSFPSHIISIICRTWNIIILCWIYWIVVRNIFHYFIKFFYKIYHLDYNNAMYHSLNNIKFNIINIGHYVAPHNKSFRMSWLCHGSKPATAAARTQCIKFKSQSKVLDFRKIFWKSSHDWLIIF